MIDWLSVILPVDEIMPGGHVMKISPDGEVISTNISPFQVTGSFSNQVMVCNIASERSLRGQPLAKVNVQKTFVYISGNPSKYLQGHNIYGSNDLKALASKFFSKIAKELGFSLDIRNYSAPCSFTFIKLGDFPWNSSRKPSDAVMPCFMQVDR